MQKKRSEVENLPNSTKPVSFLVERLNINPALTFISSNNITFFSYSFASVILLSSVSFLIISGLKLDPVEANPMYLDNVDWCGSCKNPEDMHLN